MDPVLELADVALEPRAQREAPGHVLGEELRCVGLGTVDRGRPTHDDRAHRLGLLARREQLERSDHVDVVQLGGRLAGLRHQEHVAVDHRVDLGLRQQLRQQRVADVGADELGAAEVRRRRSHVEARDVLELRGPFEPAGELRRFDQRRESAVEREDRLTLEREPLAVAPERRPTRRDGVGIGQQTIGIVHRLQRTQTFFADRHRCGRLFRAAETAGLRQRAQGWLGEGRLAFGDQCGRHRLPPPHHPDSRHRLQRKAPGAKKTRGTRGFLAVV